MASLADILAAEGKRLADQAENLLAREHRADAIATAMAAAKYLQAARVLKKIEAS